MQHLEYFGLLSFLIVSAGLALIPIFWRTDPRYTFSQNVAKQRSSIIYYIGLFALFLPIFLLFMVGWFIPYFSLPSYSYIFVWIAAITQFACTLVPETKGWKVPWHRFFAGTSAFSLIPIVYSLTTIPFELIQAAAIGSIVVMIASATVFLRNTKLLGESLYIQIAYYLAAFLPILLATHIET